MSQPFAMLTASAGQALMQVRGMQDGHGSNPRAAPGASINSSSKNRGAKRDPWPVHRMHHDAEDARSAKPCGLPRLHEVQRRALAHEWIDDGGREPRLREHRRDIAFDDDASEIIQRVVARHPPRILIRMPFECFPERAAAVADHDDRLRARGDRINLIFGFHGRVVSIGGSCGYQIQTAGRGCRSNRIENRTHATISITKGIAQRESDKRNRAKRSLRATRPYYEAHLKPKSRQ